MHTPSQFTGARVRECVWVWFVFDRLLACLWPHVSSVRLAVIVSTGLFLGLFVNSELFAARAPTCEIM